MIVGGRVLLLILSYFAAAMIRSQSARHALWTVSFCKRQNRPGSQYKQQD